MLQLSQQMETERSVICLPIFMRKSAFMELSLSKKEKLFIMKLNSLMVWNSTEDTFLPTLLLTKRNKKLSLRTVMYLLLKRNLETLEKFYLSSNLLINNKNHSWLLQKISKVNSLLVLFWTESKTISKSALSKHHLSVTTEKHNFKILLSSQEENSSVKKQVWPLKTVQLLLNK